MSLNVHCTESTVRLLMLNCMMNLELHSLLCVKQGNNRMFFCFFAEWRWISMSHDVFKKQLFLANKSWIKYLQRWFSVKMEILLFFFYCFDSKQSYAEKCSFLGRNSQNFGMKLKKLSFSWELITNASPPFGLPTCARKEKCWKPPNICDGSGSSSVFNVLWDIVNRI